MKSTGSQYRLAMDTGERHLFAIVCDRQDTPPVLVPNIFSPGKGAASRSMGRTNQENLESIRAYIRSCCTYLLALCARWEIRSVVIGNRAIKNPFKVPYASLKENPTLNLHIQVVSAFRCECILQDIDVEVVDEAFTSQIDALGLEEFPSACSNREKRRGKAGLRGRMYCSQNGELLDRDINVAINIGRLAYGDSFALPIIKSRRWNNPIRAVFAEEKRSFSATLSTRFNTRFKAKGAEYPLFSQFAVHEMACISLCVN